MSLLRREYTITSEDGTKTATATTPATFNLDADRERVIMMAQENGFGNATVRYIKDVKS